MKNRNIIVIGAGASGMLAAIMAACAGASVTILEQNDKVGKKLAATGNGRCNLTNRNMGILQFCTDTPEVVSGILEKFSQKDTMEFFESIGVRLTDREGYVYPRTGQAQTVINALEQALRKQKVKLKTKEKVIRMIPPGKNLLWQVITTGWRYEADAVIWAGGSCASGIAGADGSGYEIVKDLGIRVTKVLPALVPLKAKGNQSFGWAGTRTRGKVALYVDNRKILEEQGEIQLTENGISGIPVFQISRYASRALSEQKEVVVKVDFIPEMTEQQWMEYLDEHRNGVFSLSKEQLLQGIFPDRLLKVLFAQKDPVKAAKEFIIPIDKTGDMGQAQICTGGIPFAEVDPLTLESIRCPGLYFCGEILDVDGKCGGYNLQWAWSSGAVAGRSASLIDKRRY
ncbi:MAG: aminoacetone oxidase family FAD-binding enzyme [Blautia sp.]|nr:aminoacetone oxidase family FAD-binding enzyme [Blautia sp.]